MTPEDAVLAAAERALFEGDVVTDPDRLASYRSDRSTGSVAGEPFAVAFPRTTEHVAALLSAAYEHRVPVVPRGAGSGLSGGSNAIDGSLIVCVERMNSVLAVEPGNGYVETQPGVLNQELREHVAKSGLWYAPDPASKDFCSIGGNVNTNAGGLCCVKYGVTRDAVLGLEVVLSDGRVTRLGRRTVKGVAGYDLAGLMVGSEGTLGIVTMARLRLRPLPPPPTTAVAVFADMEAAGRAVERIMTVCSPSLLELMDQASLRAVEQWQPMGLDTTAAALLVAQSDLPGNAGEAEADLLLAECERAGATEIYRSEDPEQADLLLGARRLVIPALEQLGDWLLDDIAVPRTRLAEAVLAIEEIAQRQNVLIATFGHAGDGNLHPTIVTDRGDSDAAERALTAFHDIVDVALRLDGTVTGEHGVGLLKRQGLAAELDPVASDLHSRIKTALDPRDILNPGKALPRWWVPELPTRLAAKRGNTLPGQRQQTRREQRLEQIADEERRHAGRNSGTDRQRQTVGEPEHTGEVDHGAPSHIRNEHGYRGAAHSATGQQTHHHGGDDESDEVTPGRAEHHARTGLVVSQHRHSEQCQSNVKHLSQRSTYWTDRRRRQQHGKRLSGDRNGCSRNRDGDLSGQCRQPRRCENRDDIGGRRARPVVGEDEGAGDRDGKRHDGSISGATTLVAATRPNLPASFRCRPFHRHVPPPPPHPY